MADAALFGRVTAAVLLVALAIVGCGDAERGGAGKVGPGLPSGVPGRPDPGRPDPGDQEVAWVPPGPGSLAPGGDPDDHPRPWDRWVWAFDHRDCDAIAALGQERHQQPLYEGLGDACRAVLRDEDRSWPAAEAALQNVSNPTNCLDQRALRLLRDLVTAHQRAPNARIRIVDHPPGRECD